MSSNLNLTSMPSTPTPGQGSTLFNTMGGEVDALLSNVSIEAVYDSDGDVTLVDTDPAGGDNNIRHVGAVLLPSGASGAFDVFFPATVKRLAMLIDNNSGQTATLKVSGQSTSPTLADAAAALVSLDGTIVRAVTLTGA